MLIYNTTFHVEGENNLSPFLTYMRDVYVPAAIRDGLLQNPRFVRLLTEVGDNLFGYALMCEVEANFHQQFGEKVLMFSTSMKDVTEKVVGSE